MTREQLTAQLLALSLSVRVEIAQALWQSIEEGMQGEYEREAIEEAKRRYSKLKSGEVVGVTKQEAMEAARRALECA